MSRNLYLLVFVFLVFTQNAHAVAAFARQTGFECFMCHANSQTTLNKVGRMFAYSSYQMTKGEDEDSLFISKEEGLDARSVLNMSLMLKARMDQGYDVINGKGMPLQSADEEELGANRGLYEIFKTSTINLGGKVFTNMGTLLELREKEEKVIFGGKFISSFQTGDAYSGIALFSTNNYGPFSGMEMHNTGLYKPLRQFENHKLTNAAQAADLGSGEASGAQVFYAGDILFISVGAYVPIHYSEGMPLGGALGFARVTLEKQLNDLNLVVGAYGINGSVTANNTTFDSALSGLLPSSAIEFTKESYGVDLQLEGEIFAMPSLLSANAVFKNKSEIDKPLLMNFLVGPVYEQVYGEPANGEMQAYSVSFEIYPVPMLGLKMAYLYLDDSSPYTYEIDKVDSKDKVAYSAGFDYNWRQNVMFTLEYSYVDANRQDIVDYSDLLAVLTVSF